MVVTLVVAFEDDVAFGVVGDKSAFADHAVVGAIVTEDELVVGEVLGLQFCVTIDDDVTLVPATLPGAYDDLAEALTIVITTSAGEEEEGEEEEERLHLLFTVYGLQFTVLVYSLRFTVYR